MLLVAVLIPFLLYPSCFGIRAFSLTCDRLLVLLFCPLFLFAPCVLPILCNLDGQGTFGVKGVSTTLASTSAPCLMETWYFLSCLFRASSNLSINPSFVRAVRNQLSVLWSGETASTGRPRNRLKERESLIRSSSAQSLSPYQV